MADSSRRVTQAVFFAFAEISSVSACSQLSISWPSVRPRYSSNARLRTSSCSSLLESPIRIVGLKLVWEFLAVINSSAF